MHNVNHEAVLNWLEFQLFLRRFVKSLETMLIMTMKYVDA